MKTTEEDIKDQDKYQSYCEDLMRRMGEAAKAVMNILNDDINEKEQLFFLCSIKAGSNISPSAYMLDASNEDVANAIFAWLYNTHAVSIRDGYEIDFHDLGNGFIRLPDGRRFRIKDLNGARIELNIPDPWTHGEPVGRG